MEELNKKAVIDTGYFINKSIDLSQIKEGFITTSVSNEIKDKLSKEYLHMISYLIKIQDPTNESINFVKKKTKNKFFNLSKTDIEVCALVKDLIDSNTNDNWITQENMNNFSNEVICLTTDGGVKSALKHLNLYEDNNYLYKKYKLRCYACDTLFDEDIDFCTNCGYTTITRVAVIEGSHGEIDRVCLKKGYKAKERIIKDDQGKKILSADSKKYKEYLKNKQQHN